MTKRQLNLPFEEQIGPGWVGKRYLLCSDNTWHLVLDIMGDGRVNTQCCADAFLVPQPECSNASMCNECSQLQFAPKK